MKDIVLGVLVAALGGAAIFFYFESKANINNQPRWGELSAVNQVVLATHEIFDSCTHKDDEDWGEGVIIYDWKFEFAFGLDIPINHTWDVEQTTPGNFTINTPPLTQLRPLIVDFTRFVETNQADGDRWERMYEYAKPAAITRLDRAMQVDLNNDRIRQVALGAAQNFFEKILQHTMSDGQQFNSVTVVFGLDNEVANSEGLITAEEC